MEKILEENFNINFSHKFNTLSIKNELSYNSDLILNFNKIDKKDDQFYVININIKKFITKTHVFYRNDYRENIFAEKIYKKFKEIVKLINNNDIETHLIIINIGYNYDIKFLKTKKNEDLDTIYNFIEAGRYLNTKENRSISMYNLKIEAQLSKDMYESNTIILKMYK